MLSQEELLEALQQAQNIVDKPEPTGEEVGRLFLLSSALEMNNQRQGANIAPFTHKQLEAKANSLLSLADKDTLRIYINLMNSIRASYNLGVGHKINVMYRLTGLERILDTVDFYKEGVRLTGGTGDYTEAGLLEKVSQLHNASIKKIEDMVISDAHFVYAHNIMVDLLIEQHNMKELEVFKLNVNEMEAEVELVYSYADSIQTGLNVTEKYVPNLDTLKLVPTEETLTKAREFISNDNSYNNISPNMEVNYILLCKTNMET